jgi:hypothetical protein
VAYDHPMQMQTLSPPTKRASIRPCL